MGAAMNDELLLEVEGVEVDYGKLRAVDGVSFTLVGGACLAILGRNGAGKSSLLEAVAGLLPRSGDVRIAGVAVPPGDPSAARRAGMSIVLERRELFPSMAVEDNLMLGTAFPIRSLTRTVRRRADALPWVYELFPVLFDRRRQRAGSMSGGEQQMLAVGRALLSRPRILLLDEPSFGLAPLIVERIYEVLHMLRRQGVTLVVVEENATRAVDLADHLLVLETGSTKLTATGDDIARNPGLLSDAYFERPR